MRICLVNEYFPPFAPGGAEWSTEALARALAARGHEVVVATPNWGAARHQSRDGFTVVRFPFPKTLPPGRRTASAKWFANPFFYLYAGACVWWIARRARAEVIHVQNKHMLIPGWLSARALRIPVLLTIRDGSIIDAAPMCLHYGDRMPPDCGVRKLWRDCAEDYLWRYGRRGRLRTKLGFLYLWSDARLRQRFLRRLDCVIGVSREILDIYGRSKLLEPHVRRETIYNLPPLAGPPPTAKLEALRRELDVAGRPVVLYVGKRSEGKGTPYLLRALEQVVRRIPESLFVFVGDGSAIPESAHIRCLGARPNQEVLALYPLAHVVVVPSIIPEALNRVILEAMAAGCPVVATNVGGNGEMVEPEVNGLLVERRRPDDLANAIVRILTDSELRARMGSNARGRIEQFLNPGENLERLVSIYKELATSSALAR